MLLVLEIYYSVKAFKKGWRFRAFLPMVLVFVGGVFIGLMTEHPENVTPVAVVLDVCMLFVMRYMSRHAPADAIAASEAQAIEKPATVGLAV
jgi:hypothetical protein